MHLTIKERVELVLMSGADGFCYYYLNCFICFGALFMAQNVCYYYLNCFICFGALFMAQNVCYYYLNCFICFGALFMAHPVYLTLPVANTDGQSSFSALKRVKNYLRSSLTPDHLCDFCIIAIEKRFTKSMSFEDIIDKFAAAKCRKHQL